MREKLKQINRILESFQTFALVEPFVSPEVAINSIFQDIVDAMGMHSYGKKIYHKDMYGGSAEEGEMSGQITFGWKDGDHVNEKEINSTVKISLTPSHVAVNVFDANGRQWERFIASRDGGNYVSLISDIVASVKDSLSNQSGIDKPLFHDVEGDPFGGLVV